jgi:DNA/RNA endonuclease YhcR with UshA esterase domain
MLITCAVKMEIQSANYYDGMTMTRLVQEDNRSYLFS